MLFTSKCKTKALRGSIFGGNVLKFSDFVNYLGVAMERRLSTYVNRKRRAA